MFGVVEPKPLPTDKKDEREWPCPDCDAGEMVQDGFTQPNGLVTYVCNECSHTETYP
jgi:hypothetical protein